SWAPGTSTRPATWRSAGSRRSRCRTWRRSATTCWPTSTTAKARRRRRRRRWPRPAGSKRAPAAEPRPGPEPAGPEAETMMLALAACAATLLQPVTLTLDGWTAVVDPGTLAVRAVSEGGAAVALSAPGPPHAVAG